MTTISSSITMGRQMMDARISQAVSSGKISSTDQTAFEAALDNIDSSLTSASTASTTGASGSDMASTMDSLIQDQVSSGTLTSDQASELQSFFSQAGQSGQVHHGGHHGGGGESEIAALAGSSTTTGTADSDSADTGSDDFGSTQGFGQIAGMGGPQGMQGPPPPPPPGDSATDGSATDSSDGSTTTTASGSTDATTDSASSTDLKQLDAFITFLENLRSSMSSTYGSTTDTSSANAGVLINATA